MLKQRKERSFEVKGQKMNARNLEACRRKSGKGKTGNSQPGKTSQSELIEEEDSLKVKSTRRTKRKVSKMNRTQRKGIEKKISLWHILNILFFYLESILKEVSRNI